MNTQRNAERTVLEWCFRYGVPALAWGLVFAFFAFAGFVSTGKVMPASDGASSPLTSVASVSGAPAALPTPATPAAVDDSVPQEFTRFALNALLATLLDDDEPPRWTDVALGHVCGAQTRVLIDGRPLSPGSRVPSTAFTVRWKMDRCNQLEAFDVSGTVDLLVYHEDTGFTAIVTPAGLTVSSANGVAQVHARFTSTLSLLQTRRP